MTAFKTDVAIVGAGPAGLAAAAEAAFLGLQVDIFEKSSNTGGIMKGGQGPFAAGSFVQDKFGHPLSKEDAFNYLMDFTHWKTDAKLVSKYVNMSSETIEWFADMGIDFTGVSAYYEGAEYTEHNFNHFKLKLTTLLLSKAQENGARLHCDICAKSLVIKNGRVTGFRGISGDGADVEVEAKAVILATGGFGGSEWMVEELGFHKDKDLFYTFDMPNNTGDGLKMAWAAGAGRSETMLDIYCGLAKPFGGPGGTNGTMRVFREPNLMVNLKGERFVRENLFANPAYIGNAIHRQLGGCGLMIIDEGIMNEYLENDKKHGAPGGPVGPGGPDGPSMEISEGDPMFAIMDRSDTREKLEQLAEAGDRNFFIADSISELASKVGIDAETLEKTIRQYNSLSSSGSDPEFFKPAEYLKPIKTPRFYAAKFFCDTYGGLGGIAINHRAQVIDDNRDPIAGLFAAGNDANSIFGDTYPFYLCGNTSGFAYNTGRLAAISSVEYVNGLHK